MQRRTPPVGSSWAGRTRRMFAAAQSAGRGVPSRRYRTRVHRAVDRRCGRDDGPDTPSPRRAPIRERKWDAANLATLWVAPGRPQARTSVANGHAGRAGCCSPRSVATLVAAAPVLPTGHGVGSAPAGALTACRPSPPGKPQQMDIRDEPRFGAVRSSPRSCPRR